MPVTATVMWGRVRPAPLSTCSVVTLPSSGPPASCPSVTSRASESSQHVGRIVDPDVRDDGGLEPVIEYGVPAPTAAELAEPVDRVSRPAASEGVTEVAPVAVAPSSAIASDPFELPDLEVPIRGRSFPTSPSASASASGEAASPGRFEPTKVEPSFELQLPEPQFTPLPPGVKPLPPSKDPLFAADSGAPARQAESDDQNASRLATRAGSSASLGGTSQGGEPAEPWRAPLDFEGLSDDDPSLRKSREFALDRVSGGLLGQKPIALTDGAQLSPNWVAVFTAAIGILVVVTILSIAMRLDPRTELPGPITAPHPSAVATAPQLSESPLPVPKPRRQRNVIPGPYRIKDSSSDPALRVLEGQIGFDPFLKAVEKAGLPLREAYRVVQVMGPVHPLDSCSKHDKFAILVERGTQKLRAFEYIVSAEEIYQARVGADGKLTAQKLELKIQQERVEGAFALGEGGLERAITDAGFEPALLRTLREALTGHLSLDELDRGARVRVIAQEVTALGAFSRYAGVEALEVVFPADRQPLRIYYFNGPKSRGYFDETARAPFEGGWRSPIPNAPVTSKFNMKRMHPVLHKIMPHTGVDFGSALGTPVGASTFGTISFIGWGGPSGNLVKVQHAGDVETGYAHLSRFADGLKVGDKVTRLQTIGYVGSTGRSTGPHLHFTAKRKGEFIDPLTLNLDALRVLPSDERAVFMEHKAQYDGRLAAIALPPLPAVGTSPGSGPGRPEGDEDETIPVSSAQSAPNALVGEAALAPTPGTPPAASGPTLYLTDEELLRQQKSTVMGEVDE